MNSRKSFQNLLIMSCGIMCRWYNWAMTRTTTLTGDKTMSYSRKQLATVDTADFDDCVNTGYRYTLYADGRVSAEYHSRWQGSEDGSRYTTEPGAVDLRDMDESDPDHDAEALLTAWIDGEYPAEDIEQGGRTWRQTRRGCVVR